MLHRRRARTSPPIEEEHDFPQVDRFLENDVYSTGEFQAWRICEGCNATVRSLQVLAPWLGLMWATHSLFGPVPWRTSGVATAMIAILALCCMKIKQRFVKLLLDHPHVCGACFQSGTFLMAFILTSWVCFRMPSALLQHRAFCLGIMGLINLYNVHCSLPLYTNIAIFSTMVAVVWIVFHYSVDFLTPSCMFYLLMVLVYQVRIFVMTDHAVKQSFEFTKKLGKDKQYLAEVQATLIGMLASLFDASCTVHHDGEIFSGTPQLWELLGRTETSLSASANICEFMATSQEADRLRSFLQHAAVNAHRRAETIQVTLLGVSQNRGLHEAFEVQLYTIIQPNRDEDRGGAQATRLFIGFQAREKQPRISPAHGEFSVSAATQAMIAVKAGEDAPGPKAEVPKQASASQAMELVKLVDSEMVQHCDTPGQAFSEYDAVLSVSISDCVSNDRLHENLKKSIQDASTQTISLKGRPPCLPRGPRRRAVVLQTSKRVLRRYSETPKDIVKLSLSDALQHMNPCGSGCCAYHILTTRAYKVLQEMVLADCIPAFKPFAGWQCERCLSMNESNDDQENEVFCSVCGEERAVGTQSSYSPSSSASE